MVGEGNTQGGYATHITGGYATQPPSTLYKKKSRNKKKMLFFWYSRNFFSLFLYIKIHFFHKLLCREMLGGALVDFYTISVQKIVGFFIQTTPIGSKKMYQSNFFCLSSMILLIVIIMMIFSLKSTIRIILLYISLTSAESQ